MASGETNNFETMMETPNALRFASTSFASESESEKGRRQRKRNKRTTG